MLDLTLFPDFYASYPEAFRERIQTLTVERRAALSALNVQLEAAIAAEDMQTYEARSTQIKQRYEQYCQSVSNAHAQYNVPELKPWSQALKDADRAIYHQLRPYPDQTIQAELRRGEGQEIILVYSETQTFDASDALESECDVSLPGRIESHLHYRDISLYGWQSVPSSPSTESHRRCDQISNQAALSVQTDTTTTTSDDTLPFPRSPLARPGESDEDRVKRLLSATHEGAANDCLTEANYWSVYYINVERVDLEPILTTISLTEHAQSLIFPTANVTAARSSAQ